MPGPLEPARLAFRDGVPYSEAFGDAYHSAEGGAAQAAHVFLAGNGLPGRWAGRRRFVVLETGFGAGLNFLVTWRAWRRDPRRCERLHFVSVEKHPLALADAQLFHDTCPEVKREAAELHALWPLLVPGAQRIELDAGRVVLTVHFDDARVLRDLRLAADAVYLDGFAPAKNPEMWSPALMRSVSRLCAEGATLATWSVAAPVREALERTGFALEKRPGFGHKKEMLVARSLKGKVPSSSERKAVVVGAGLAGAAVCERLCARGWEVELYERHAGPAQEASGNLAGTFHPLATPDDSVIARLTRAGFLYSLSRWRDLSFRWDPCGVLQLARSAKEDASQRRAVAGWPAGYAQYVTREEASAHAGVPLPSGGLWFPQSGWVQPPSLVDAQLAACGSLLKRRMGVELKKIPETAVVILANSGDAPKLHPVPHLRLRRVRGQLTYVPQAYLEPPHVVVIRGGMVLPPVDGLCVVGASYDIDDEDPAPRADSHAGNIERMREVIGSSPADLSSLQGRVAFRAVTPDRLPVVGRIADDVCGAFAYGSRGLVWAALAAELIASDLEGEPLPVAGQLADALSPGRFRRRAESRGSPA